MIRRGRVLEIPSDHQKVTKTAVRLRFPPNFIHMTCEKIPFLSCVKLCKCIHSFVKIFFAGHGAHQYDPRTRRENEHPALNAVDPHFFRSTGNHHSFWEKTVIRREVDVGAFRLGDVASQELLLFIVPVLYSVESSIGYMATEYLEMASNVFSRERSLLKAESDITKSVLGGKQEDSAWISS
jgi:hypothetical protein